jgi:pimeloyl-ACP methyl ester carboxylesterase
VFLHGLFETERDWSWQEPGEVATSYAEQLQDCLPVTSIQIRYNTGLRISENGRHLAELLDGLVRAWPVPVVSISLVGHSMGGLVARSACHAGQREGADWTARVRSVVTLGSPHLGSPVEKAVHLADWALRKVPELEPLGRLVAARSVGIKDLRFGAVVEEDWHGHDPDEFLRDRCTQIPFLEGADYYWVAASLTRDPGHPVGRLVGDGLVRLASASGNGRTRSVPLDLERGLHVTGASHFALMRHEAVLTQLRRWLEPQAVAG